MTHRIQHAGGATEISVNQQQPSAGWFRVGTFSMGPGQNHRVEVAGALEGETVADAVRFVSAGTSAPGIHYVHADHLGSPQKMTDATQAIVWDAVYTPFGQVHSITGMATNNQRFPGQYADAETGFNYNYFRDYDPTTGRYVQSDPIGLGGGLNTYGYVRGNPFRWSDSRGLFLDSAHDFITREAARRVGCENLMDDLAKETVGQDHLPGSQDPDKAYWHHMRDGITEQSIGEAEALYNKWIADNFAAANPDALQGLGTALHGVQDSVATGHADFQPWYGLNFIDHGGYILKHIFQDLIDGFNGTLLEAAISKSVDMLNDFKRRFPCACQKATGGGGGTF